MESRQPYLSFLFLTFLNKRGNFTFLPSVLSPVSKSNIKEVPWNNQNIHNYYSIVWKTLLINQKRVSTFFYPPFPWVLTTRNVWVGSRTDIILKPKSFRSHFLLIPLATQSMIKSKHNPWVGLPRTGSMKVFSSTFHSRRKRHPNLSWPALLDPRFFAGDKPLNRRPKDNGMTGIQPNVACAYYFRKRVMDAQFALEQI